MKIIVVGAGHAGVEAARVARAAGADVTLYSAESGWPYYRPRLIALAMGQTGPADILMKTPEWYAGQGITLHVNAPVTRLDPAAMTVTSAGGTESGDAVILAYGAGPFLPPFAKDPPPGVFPLWTEAHALAIRSRLQPGLRLVIIGGGVLGIEAAVRAVDAQLQVTVIEKMQRLLPGQFGEEASALLARALAARKIDVRCGCGVTALAADAAGGVRLDLDDDQHLVADLVVVSIGARRDVGLAAAAGLKTDQGIVVDEHLRASAPRVWAAGDIIELAGVRRCSALDATQQGRLAAENCLADLAGKPLQKYHAAPAAMHLKYNDFEIHAVGQAPDTVIRTEPAPGALQNFVVRNGLLIGAQMVGTGRDFVKLEKNLGRPYPPAA